MLLNSMLAVGTPPQQLVPFVPNECLNRLMSSSLNAFLEKHLLKQVIESEELVDYCGEFFI